jgi:hypothetical protein
VWNGSRQYNRGFRVDGDGRELFADFAAICRRASFHSHEQVLPDEFRPERLVSADSVAEGERVSLLLDPAAGTYPILFFAREARKPVSGISRGNRRVGRRRRQAQTPVHDVEELGAELTPQFQIPSRVFNTPQFGTITETINDNRDIQFALRLLW